MPIEFRNFDLSELQAFLDERKRHREATKDVSVGNYASKSASGPREWDVEALKDLIIHCDIHSAYRKCGYDQMTTEQKALWDAIRAEWVAEQEAEESGEVRPEPVAVTHTHQCPACGHKGRLPEPFLSVGGKPVCPVCWPNNKEGLMTPLT